MAAPTLLEWLRERGWYSNEAQAVRYETVNDVVCLIPRKSAGSRWIVERAIPITEFDGMVLRPPSGLRDARQVSLNCRGRHLLAMSEKMPFGWEFVDSVWPAIVDYRIVSHPRVGTRVRLNKEGRRVLQGSHNFSRAKARGLQVGDIVDIQRHDGAPVWVVRWPCGTACSLPSHCFEVLQ